MSSRVLAIALVALLGACEQKNTSSAAAATSASASAPPTPAPAASSAPAPAAPSASAAAPDAIAAQHVLVAWKGAKNASKSVTRSKADAKKRAEEVSQKAKAGADFSQLVAEYTDDEGTKGRQGNLGKFTRAKMVPAFADAAFALKVGESSAPVETEFGYHVIKRNQ